MPHIELMPTEQATRTDVLNCVHYIDNVSEQFANRDAFLWSVIAELMERTNDPLKRASAIVARTLNSPATDAL